MIEILIVYVLIGSGIAALMALGAAKMAVQLTLLGRPMTPYFPLIATLVAAVLLWPLVIWLAIAGRKSDAQVVQTAHMAQQGAEVEAARDQARALYVATQKLP